MMLKFSQLNIYIYIYIYATIKKKILLKQRNRRINNEQTMNCLTLPKKQSWGSAYK